jgi:hypothetical protein
LSVKEETLVGLWEVWRLVTQRRQRHVCPLGAIVEPLPSALFSMGVAIPLLPESMEICARANRGAESHLQPSALPVRRQ